MSRSDAGALDLLGDVVVSITAQLGNARIPLSGVLAFAPGAVIPLDCAADAPATLLVNGVAVAIGDIVVDEAGVLSIEISRLSR
jgi:flagellar motor switch/type III secretory pathway protein FliN